VHPDKNQAPKATEAFKKVSAAYACLTDNEKRKIYDMTGEEPGNSQPSRNASRGFRHDRFEQEVDPEEIFRMFFGGSPFHPPRQRYNNQRQPRNNSENSDDPMTILR
jgi:DnaJ homolog subfamily B member 12